MTPIDNSTPVEEAVAKLYLEFFRLRGAGKYQEEYDAMGALISMLTEDRQHMRIKYPQVLD